MAFSKEKIGALVLKETDALTDIPDLGADEASFRNEGGLPVFRNTHGRQSVSEGKYLRATLGEDLPAGTAVYSSPGEPSPGNDFSLVSFSDTEDMTFLDDTDYVIAKTPFTYNGAVIFCVSGFRSTGNVSFLQTRVDTDNTLNTSGAWNYGIDHGESYVPASNHRIGDLTFDNGTTMRAGFLAFRPSNNAFTLYRVSFTPPNIGPSNVQESAAMLDPGTSVLESGHAEVVSLDQSTGLFLAAASYRDSSGPYTMYRAGLLSNINTTFGFAVTVPGFVDSGLLDKGSTPYAPWHIFRTGDKISAAGDDYYQTAYDNDVVGVPAPDINFFPFYKRGEGFAAIINCGSPTPMASSALLPEARSYSTGSTFSNGAYWGEDGAGHHVYFLGPYFTTTDYFVHVIYDSAGVAQNAYETAYSGNFNAAESTQVIKLSDTVLIGCATLFSQYELVAYEPGATTGTVGTPYLSTSGDTNGRRNPIIRKDDTSFYVIEQHASNDTMKIVLFTVNPTTLAITRSTETLYDGATYGTWVGLYVDGYAQANELLLPNGRILVASRPSGSATLVSLTPESATTPLVVGPYNSLNGNDFVRLSRYEDKIVLLMAQSSVFSAFTLRDIDPDGLGSSDPILVNRTNPVGFSTYWLPVLRPDGYITELASGTNGSTYAIRATDTKTVLRGTYIRDITVNPSSWAVTVGDLKRISSDYETLLERIEDDSFAVATLDTVAQELTIRRYDAMTETLHPASAQLISTALPISFMATGPVIDGVMSIIARPNSVPQSYYRMMFCVFDATEVTDITESQAPLSLSGSGPDGGYVVPVDEERILSGISQTNSDLDSVIVTGWGIPGRAAGKIYKTSSNDRLRAENYVGLTLSAGVEDDVVLVQREGPIASTGLTPGELVRFDENGDLTHEEQFYPKFDVTVGRATAADQILLERVKDTRVYQPVYEHLRDTGQLSTASAHTVFHNFGDKPQLVNLWYFDGSDEYYLNSAAYVGEVTDTTMAIDTSSLTFGGGEYVRYEILAFPTGPSRYAVEGSLYRSAWLTSTSTTEVSHNLGSIEAVRGGAIVEWNTSTGRARVLPLNTLVTDFDDEKFYLDWGSLSPSATLKYRIVGSNAPMPQGLYTEVGGYTKFVGHGPGYYANLEDAVADAAAGDRILVFGTADLTGTLEVSADDIEIEFMPGVAVSEPLLVTGNRVSINGYRMVQGAGESWAYAVRIEGNEVTVNGKLEVDSGGTVTDIVNVQTGAEFSTANMIYRSNGGTVTNEITNLGDYSDIVVRGA